MQTLSAVPAEESEQPARFNLEQVESGIKPIAIGEHNKTAVTTALREWWHLYFKWDFMRDEHRQQKMKVDAALKKFTPFNQDALSNTLSCLIPDRRQDIKMPELHFGWLLSMPQLEEMGRQESALCYEEYDGDDDDDDPPRAVWSVVSTARKILTRVRQDLGLNNSGDFYRYTMVWSFCDASTIFFVIYSSRHLMPNAKAELPTAEEIERFQKRLQIPGEPAWWFDINNIPQSWPEALKASSQGLGLSDYPI